jgi:cbb3-type cytochrome oxidase maturation protein
MTVLGFLIPIALLLGGLGLAAFIWALRSGQFSDPDGDAARILIDDPDDRPSGQ